MKRCVVRLAVAAASACVALGLVLVSATQSADKPAAAEPAPPASREYIGSKRCATCHFEEFGKWNKTGHAKALDLLPANKKQDPKCLACHTTGFGHPGGYKDEKSTPSLAGVGCEICHGPGSEHEGIATKYAEVEKLSAEQEKEIHNAIWLMNPKNVCVECHRKQAHKDSTPSPGAHKKT